MAKKKKRRIPKVWIVIDKKSHTTSTRNQKTGKLTGRKNVKGIGDKTRVRRVSKGIYAGQIFGRTPSIKVKGDRKKRATIRRRV